MSDILGAPEGQLATINSAINTLTQQQSSFIESMNYVVTQQHIEFVGWPFIEGFNELFIQPFHQQLNQPFNGPFSQSLHNY